MFVVSIEKILKNDIKNYAKFSKGISKDVSNKKEKWTDGISLLYSCGAFNGNT